MSLVSPGNDTALSAPPSHSQTDRTSASATDPSRLGPNLLESLSWVGLYFLLQNLAFAATLGLIAFAAFGTLQISWNQLIEFIIELDLDRSFVLIGVPGLAALLAIFPLVRWRMGPTWRTDLRLSRPTLDQTLLVLGAVLPLGLLSDEIYRQALIVWRSMWNIPAVTETPLGLLGNHLLRTPYPILVVALALGPALAEELLFRGLIGRGLVARRGIVAGVLWTSLLFGIAHAFPPHMLATIPVGIFLHVAYLATGNLWVPILLHFFNNVLWVSLARYRVVEHLPNAPAVLLAAAVYLVILAWSLRRHSDQERLAYHPREAAFAGLGIANFTLTFVLNAVR